MYYLSECLIIRDENQYLLEHLIKGVQAGIEHFYIYDNRSVEPVEEFLRKNGSEFLEACTIERYHSDGQLQIKCYDHFLDQHRDDTKWCAFIDTDEMFEGDLLGLCEENEDYLTLRIQQILHGGNGKAYKPEGTLTDNYQSHILEHRRMVKLVSQVKYVKQQHPHDMILNDLGNSVNMRKWYKYVEWNEKCQLHHYIYRSFEEWLQKIKRGNVLPQIGAHVSEWFRENTISDEDRDALLAKYDMQLDDRMGFDYKIR